MSEKKDATLSIRIPKWLKKELAKEADADHRSIGSLVVKILVSRSQGEEVPAP